MTQQFVVTVEPEVRRRVWSSVDLLGVESLQRENEQDDRLFYSVERKRPFFRETTDAAITAHHERILPEGTRRILDLMSSMDSHLPEQPGREVVGLGLNDREMLRNLSLSSQVVHDLNADPVLPFDNEGFDAVVCSGSIDLLIQPVEILRDVARVLRPGGVFIVSFTDRAVQPKSIKGWRDESNDGRLMLTTAYFSFSGAFLRPFTEVEELATSECLVAGPGGHIGDDLLSVVWGYRPPAEAVVAPRVDPIQRVSVRSHRHCPYCGSEMALWQPPETPWEIDYGVSALHVCFSDDCPYYRRGNRWCRHNGMRCSSYRHSRNPTTGAEGPLPVPTRWALRDGIVEEA